MIIKTESLNKQYKHKDGIVNALKDINFEVNKGDFVTITGPSGSGKTTLLLSLAGLIKTSSGKIFLENFDIYKANDNQLSNIRKTKIGFVMQSFALIPYLTAIENVMLPLAIHNFKKNICVEKAMQILKMVEMSDRKNHLPSELSAGQQQRIAIARALVNQPEIILADEPTGNLDPALSTDILNLMKKINQDQKITIIMVTHSKFAADYGNVKIKLSDGQIKN